MYSNGANYGSSKTWSQRIKELVVCHLCLAVTFVTTGIVVDLAQGFLYVTVRNVSPTLYRKINYYLTYTLNSQIVFLAEWWSGSRAIIYGDPKVVKEFFGKEHAQLLLNHCYELDWLLGWLVCDRVQVLGNAKVYVKKVLQWAPILGWSWKFQEIIFLERNWEKDKKNLGKQLRRLVEYPSPFFLVMFPEGTRFTKEKHAASMIVAREKGLPELKHHLLPRTRGFVAGLPHLKGKVPAIYDVTVAFPKNCHPEPTVFNLLNGVPATAHLLMRRIPMETVPDDPEEAAMWLHKLYQHKDKCLDNFLETGKFDPNNEMEEYKNFEYMELPRRYYSLINICCWAVVILFPLLYYFTKLFTSGSMLSVLFALSILGAAYLGMYKLINLTKISSSASSYGGAGIPTTDVHAEKKEL